jgi:flagellar operon protein
MSDPLRINELIIGPQGVGPSGAPSTRPAQRPPDAPSFGDVLKQAQQTQQAQPGGLKFSAHAQTRIQSRQINLGATDMQRLDGAVQKAAGKGARESLVLLDQTAFVVSVPNRTVITVVDKDSLKQNVFTNIDSVVIA